MGINELLEAIVDKIPPLPKDGPLQAQIVDSWFDSYVGVVMLVRLFSGTLHEKSKIILMGSGKQHVVDKLGIFAPKVHEEGFKSGKLVLSLLALRKSLVRRWEIL